MVGARQPADLDRHGDGAVLRRGASVPSPAGRDAGQLRFAAAGGRRWPGWPSWPNMPRSISCWASGLARCWCRRCGSRWRNAALLLAAFALVILPNIAVEPAPTAWPPSRTPLDNVGWVRRRAPLARLNPAGLAEFFASQFARLRPGAVRGADLGCDPPGRARGAGCWSSRCRRWLMVCGAGAAGPGLCQLGGRGLFRGDAAGGGRCCLRAPASGCALSLAVNGAICLALPLLTLVPRPTPWRRRATSGALSRAGRAEPPDHRRCAGAPGDVPVVAERRDILADLFYTGRDAGLAVYAPRPRGRPRNHYEQTHPLPAGLTGPVLYRRRGRARLRRTAGRRSWHSTRQAAPMRGRALAGLPVADAECLDALR